MMRSAKNVLMAVGAMVLAAMLLSVMAPKAVHAVTATMVEVVNTTSNPVPSQDIYRLPAKNVQLVCNASVNNCAIAEQNGTFDASTPWKVPSGMDFIITDVEITTIGTGSATTSSFAVGWTPPGGKLIGFAWQVLNNGATTEYQFTNGIVILAGSTPTPEFGPSVNFAAVRGYLTPN
ncbi:MAG: hypothetical protein WCD49_04760 [Candidatus Acidiferrales bacterium]